MLGSILELATRPKLVILEIQIYQFWHDDSVLGNIGCTSQQIPFKMSQQPEQVVVQTINSWDD